MKNKNWGKQQSGSEIGGNVVKTMSYLGKVNIAPIKMVMTGGWL
jgi:hypothetical protein